MTEVVLFHHVMGLTDGVRRFAEKLSDERHRIHVPDLYDGRVADSLEDGFAIRTDVGDATINARVVDVLDDLGDAIVYAGISMGVMTAQRLAQTRPDAVGALLYESCVPVTGEFAFGPWPDRVRVQIHGMDDDEFFAHEGDIDAARAIVGLVGPDRGRLFTYPGDQHLFLDDSLPTYDAEATRLTVERSLTMLDAVG